MTKLVAICGVGLKRLLRDRSNLFTMFALPIILVFMLGSQYGDSGDVKVGLHGPPDLTGKAIERLNAEIGIEAVEMASEEEVREEARNGGVALGVEIPADAAESLAAGEQVEVTTYGPEDSSGDAIVPVVTGALALEAEIPWLAERLRNESAGGISAAEARDAVADAAGSLRRTAVEVRETGGGEVSAAAAGFGSTAAQQLVLIVFLMTLLSAVLMVQNRRLGVITRLLVTPTSVGTIVAGEAGARWTIALLQSLYIVAATALIFGVEWGNLALVGLVLVAFSAAGAGAGMLLGAMVDDEMQVVGLGILLALALAALGGAMLPREFFGDTLELVASFVPHFWALEALDAVREGRGLSAITGDLMILAAFAAVLFALAAWRLTARIARG